MHAQIYTIQLEKCLIEYILLAVHYNKQLYLPKGNKRSNGCPGCEMPAPFK